MTGMAYSLRGSNNWYIPSMYKAEFSGLNIIHDGNIRFCQSANGIGNKPTFFTLESNFSVLEDGELNISAGEPGYYMPTVQFD